MNNKDVTITPRYLSEKNAMRYTSLGRNKVRVWAKSVGAVKRVGGRILYDRILMDKALEDDETVERA